MEMKNTDTKIFDLVGVGFGPSNLSLVIALEERIECVKIDAIFLEQKPSFA